MSPNPLIAIDVSGSMTGCEKTVQQGVTRYADGENVRVAFFNAWLVAIAELAPPYDVAACMRSLGVSLGGGSSVQMLFDTLRPWYAGQLVIITDGHIPPEPEDSWPVPIVWAVIL